MEPTSVDKKGDEYVIQHVCKTCGKIINNKSVPNDNFDIIIELSNK
ncbi:MAG: RNHCP domain-containing protein [bacterium]|nr:RNHCP domain-containing protein [bacterium]